VIRAKLELYTFKADATNQTKMYRKTIISVNILLIGVLIFGSEGQVRVGLKLCSAAYIYMDGCIVLGTGPTFFAVVCAMPIRRI